MRHKQKSLMPDSPLAPVPSEILDQFVAQGPISPEEFEAAVRRFKLGDRGVSGPDQPRHRCSRGAGPPPRRYVSGGTRDMLIAVTDGLKGMSEALAAVFPDTTLQTCIVHLIRHSLDFAGWRERKPLPAARLDPGHSVLCLPA